MNRFTPLMLPALLVLSSCAFFVEDSIQRVTVKTPGANESICYLDIDSTRYKVNPPETIGIQKSHKDMIVDCLAAGNRRQKQVIKPEISKYAYGNAVTGFIPGGAWDYFSGAAFKYPDIVIVDFTNTSVRREDMPAQNSPDLIQPEEHRFEEFKPGKVRENSDSFDRGFDLHPRGGQKSAVTTEIIESGTPPGVSDKGDLKRVLDSLGDSPSSAKPSPAASPSAAPEKSGEKSGPPAPAPQFPGQ